AAAKIILHDPLEKWVSPAQRGFLKGRSMNENILEMDYHAKLASLDLRCPVLILFDFKAAFPSVHHDFMWSVLEALAIPQKWRRMIALFYRNNFQKVGRGEGLGFLAEVGIRQG
ncbi:MAG: reverse transcriptase domain-containing protein, partial [Candidatus Fonsibacter sp.]